MSINSRCGRTDTAVRAGIAVRLAEIQNRLSKTTPGVWKIWGMQVMSDQKGTSNVDDAVLVAQTYLSNSERRPRTFDAQFISTAHQDVPALTNAVESVMDYVARCEESGITMQPGDVRRMIAAALGGAS